MSQGSSSPMERPVNSPGPLNLPVARAASHLEALLGVRLPGVNLTEGSYLEANVCYSDGPGKLYVHPWACRKLILKLTKLMEFMYNDTPPHFMEVLPPQLQPNAFCVAKYEGDYYRGKVVERSGPGSCMVEFCDFGNESVVGVADMKQLHPKLSFESMAPFAMQVIDYSGQEICADKNISDEEYDGMMDGRVVTIKLEECIRDGIWRARVYAYLDGSVHSLEKSVEEDVKLEELDIKSGYYALN